MNKLRKHRPTCEPSTMPPTANTSNTIAVSRTMRLAVSGVKVSAPARGGDSGSGSADLQWRSTGTCQVSTPLAAAPRTKVERYWATRAVVAETLLSAHDRHRRELAEMRRIEEQKREVSCHRMAPPYGDHTNHYKREIGAILHANNQRQRSLERLVVSSSSILISY